MKEWPNLDGGAYYPIAIVAKKFQTTAQRIRKILRFNNIETSFFQKELFVHESSLEQIQQILSQPPPEKKVMQRPLSQSNQAKCIRAGIKYYRNPPPGTPKGYSHHPGLYRRGWWLTGRNREDPVYYGPTAATAWRKYVEEKQEKS